MQRMTGIVRQHGWKPVFVVWVLNTLLGVAGVVMLVVDPLLIPADDSAGWLLNASLITCAGMPGLMTVLLTLIYVRLRWEQDKPVRGHQDLFGSISAVFVIVCVLASAVFYFLILPLEFPGG
ncbi:MAG: hypothetical protein GYB65_18435 [Chloroflexi bacterium]|nr:hypothetical protein [Chloroflexota bacterium]